MNKTIWAPKGMSEGMACTKIEIGAFEISIAMDDSCGGMPIYGRSEIRVFTKIADKVTGVGFIDLDVTHLFEPSYLEQRLVIATPEALFMIMARALTDPPEINPDTISMAKTIGPIKDNGYGYCPTCGMPGVLRERRPNGNDRCRSGHVYPSSTAELPS